MSELPKISLPKYELVLPYSKKKINFRPFVVREEKLLLLAIQEEDNTKISIAIKEVLKNCSFGLNIDSLAQIDAEYLFLQIRNKSMGEGIDAVSTCVHCGKKNFMSLDLSKTEIVQPTLIIPDTIELSPNLWITMRLPNIDDSYELAELTTAADITKVVARCVVKLINGEKIVDPKDHPIEDMIEWLEGLQDYHFTMITDYLTNVPTIKFEQEFNCIDCGKKNLILLEGMESFFD